MSRIISIVNQKGGVGKTTTAINLAASLALGGKNILVIDTDPQGNLTSGLGIERKDLRASLYDVYTGRTVISEIILSTSLENLKIAPSTIDLLGVEVELVSKERREFILSDALSSLNDDFPYIFIDCPPSLGLLTLNALVASHGVLIPVQAEYYALEGLSLLMQTLSMVKNSFNPDLEIDGILITMFDPRNALSHQVESEVRKHFRDKVYESMIPRNVSLAEAPSHGKPALLYDIKSKGAQSYLQLAKEILNEDSIRQRN